MSGETEHERDEVRVLLALPIRGGCNFTNGRWSPKSVPLRLQRRAQKNGAEISDEKKCGRSAGRPSMTTAEKAMFFWGFNTGVPLSVLITLVMR